MNATINRKLEELRLALSEGSRLKAGDKVTLPAGTPVGAGKLKQDVTATVDTIETDDKGATYHRVSWSDAKGKSRSTYWRP